MTPQGTPCDHLENKTVLWVVCGVAINWFIAGLMAGWML